MILASSHRRQSLTRKRAYISQPSDVGAEDEAAEDTDGEAELLARLVAQERAEDHARRRPRRAQHAEVDVISAPRVRGPSRRRTRRA